MSKLQTSISNASCRTWKCDGAWVSSFDEPANGLTRIFPKVLGEVYVDQMIRVAHNSFGMTLNEENEDGARQHILDTEKLVICYIEDKIIGFASAKIAKIDKKEVFFIHGIAMLPKYQRNGYANSMLAAILSMSKDRKVAFTTQSPVAYCTIASQLKWVAPNEKQQMVLPVYRKLGMQLASWRSSKSSSIFNTGTFVIRDLYDECLYRRIPSSTSQEVNEWFSKRLKIERGITKNGLLFVGERK